ncbi:MAG TPA: hypothetical protein PLD10_04700 [Rhodopila sp.]|nr:hypothetical protein [Rhodopila sp.]
MTVPPRLLVLLAVVPDSPQSRAAIGRLGGAYEMRFHQQRVGMTAAPTCARFQGMIACG